MGESQVLKGAGRSSACQDQSEHCSTENGGIGVWEGQVLMVWLARWSSVKGWTQCP